MDFEVKINLLTNTNRNLTNEKSLMLKRVKDTEQLSSEQAVRILNNKQQIIELMATKEQQSKIIPELEENLRVMTLKQQLWEEKFSDLNSKNKDRQTDYDLQHGLLIQIRNKSTHEATKNFKLNMALKAAHISLEASKRERDVFQTTVVDLNE